MMALAIVLLTLILIGFIPVGATAVYHAEGAFVTVKLGPISIPVFPKKPKKKTEKQLQKEQEKQREKLRKKEEKKARKKAAKEQKKTDKNQAKTAVNKKPKSEANNLIGGKIEFFKELLGIGLGALGCIRRKLIMKDLVLYLTVGGQGEDAAKAALLYGRAWAAVGALTPVLENTFKIKNRDIQVGIDFLSPDNVIYAKATILFRIGDLFRIAIPYGVRALRAFLKQKRKGRKNNGTSHQ